MIDINKAYVILPWDSGFFGYIVAQIIPQSLSQTDLLKLLDTLRKKNVQLVYWATNKSDRMSHSSAHSCGGSLVDKKITFVKKKEFIPIQPVSEKVLIYNYSKTTSEMIDLAIQAGMYSRFRIDKKIGTDKFKKLYSLWIQRSVQREIAHNVLIIQDTKLKNHPVIALATVGEKNNRGSIGLVAVHKNYRGQNLGTSLVHAAINWFIRNGYKESEVVTQGKNIISCNLYKKCGYEVEKTEWWYHFWL